MNRKVSVLAIFGVIVFLFMQIFPQNEEATQKTTSEKELKARFSFQDKIIFQSNFDSDNEIYMLSSNKLIKLTDNTWQDEYPAWSPDGSKIAFTSNPKGNYDIFIMNPDGSNITSITSSPADEKEPSWFPDGKSLAFTKEVKKFLRKGTAIYRKEIDSGKSKKIVPRYSKSHGIPHVSPASPHITFTGKRLFGWDVAVYDMKKNQVSFLVEGGKSCRARYSKDGTKLAYVSSEADGKGDIWTMDSFGRNKARLTKRDETYDYFPSWSPDGQYIVFNSSEQHDHNGDWKLFIIEVKTGRTHLLFDSPGNDVFPDWYK